MRSGPGCVVHRPSAAAGKPKVMLRSIELASSLPANPGTQNWFANLKTLAPRPGSVFVVSIAYPSVAPVRRSANTARHSARRRSAACPPTATPTSSTTAGLEAATELSRSSRGLLFTLQTCPCPETFATHLLSAASYRGFLPICLGVVSGDDQRPRVYFLR